MIKLEPKYKKFLLGATVSLIIVGAISVNYKNELKGLFTANTNIEVKVSGFPTGTIIDYEIMMANNTVEQGKKIINDDSVLNLPLPDDISSDKSNSLLSYNIHMTPPKDGEISSADTLDMILKLNRDNGKISLSGSGMSSFSDIIVTNGDNDISTSKKITSDWAGLFSEDSINSNSMGDEEHNKNIELAFQTIGTASDISKLSSGKIEVLFGDSTGSNRSKIRERWNWALRKMTEELSAVMVLQTATIGMFFDANIQLDTQRKHQELMARAYKDYHPSEQMCRIGTFIRSIAHSESKAEVNKAALNKILMNQYLGAWNNAVGAGAKVNNFAKLEQYSKYFCDPRDSNGATSALCAFTTPPNLTKLDHLNKDIDYTRTLGGKLTIDVDFSDGAATGTPANDIEGDEPDIIALSKNLYFPNVFEIPDYDRLRKDLRPHYKSRSYAAKMNVAHSSFLNIMGMKTRAPAGQSTTTTATTPPPALFGTGITEPPPPNHAAGTTHGAHAPSIHASHPPATGFPAHPANSAQSTAATRVAPPILAEDAGWAYMKAMLREFGIAPVDMNGNGNTTDAVDMTVEEQIDEILGERPSYYAQMEVLTKKIYQHPNFYTNLYDKPANVDRIGASIDAISLMNQRDRFESMLRREMLTSLLIEEELAKPAEGISIAIYEQLHKRQR